MISKVEGIIISETAYGETSKIMQVFTKEYGIIGIMGKGVKSIKSPLRALTLKYTYGSFNIYYKENKLSLLKDVDIINPLKNIKSDITLIGYLGYLCDLAHQVYKQNNNKIIYDLLIQGILKIEEGLDPLVITNILELKFLKFLGVGLELDSCILCGSKTNILTIDADAGGYVCQKCYTNEIIVNKKCISLIRMYYYVALEQVKELKISKEVASEINRFIDRYYERYTGLYLKSKDFLNKILSL